MAIAPLAFVLGGLGLAALAASGSKKKEAAPPPPTPTPTPEEGEAPDAVSKQLSALYSTLMTPGKTNLPELMQGASILKGNGYDEWAANVLDKASKLQAAAGDKLASVKTAQAAQDSADKAKTLKEATKNDPIIVKSPDIAPQPVVPKPLSASQEAKYQDFMRALGTPSLEGIKQATLFASVLKDAGFEKEAALLRKAAEAASKKVKVEAPPSLDSLPKEVRDKVTAIANKEGDPKKIRTFLGQLLAQYEGVPGVKEAAAVLEKAAVALETVKDAVSVIEEIDAIQKDAPEPPKKPQEVLPEKLQNAMEGALNGLGVLDGKLTGSASPQGIALAKQTAATLKANGFITEANKLLLLISAAEKKVALPEPTSSKLYVVKKDDNPYSIAKDLTGDGNRWRELVKANPHKSVQTTGTQKGNFKFLNVGEKLKLPASWASSSEAPETMPGVTKGPAKVAPPLLAEPPKTVSTPPAPQYMTTYTVKSGDNPYGITGRLLGYDQAGRKWKELVKENDRRYGGDKTVDVKTGNFKYLNAGDVLKIPASWQVPVTKVAGWHEDLVDFSSVPVVSGSDEAAEAANPASCFLNVRFESRGRYLFAHGYLGEGTDVEMFTVKVDMAPIAAAVAKMHVKLHGGDVKRAADFVGGCIAGDCIDVEGCVGCDAEVGKFKFNPGKAFKKAKKAVKKVAKSKALRKIKKVLRSNRALKKKLLKAAAVAFPPVGAPAYTAYTTANKVWDKAEEYKKKYDRIKKRVRGGLKTARKLAEFGKKVMSRKKRALMAKASKKGLFNKFGQNKVLQSINKASKGAARKSISRVFKKAPHLKRQVSKSIAMSRKLEAVRKGLAAQNPMVQKMKVLASKAQQGDRRAIKALKILKAVKNHRDRTVQRGTGVPRGTVHRRQGIRRPPSVRGEYGGRPEYYQRIGVAGCVGCE